MQKEIQLTDKTLLVLGLPKEANRFKMFPDIGSKPYLSYFIGVETHREYVGIGYELLGIYTELTEDMAHILVEQTFDGNLKKYFNYKKGYYSHSLFTAKESFQSLMERENITGYDKYAILIKSK